MVADPLHLIPLNGRPDLAPLVAPGAIDAHGPDMTATFAADVSLRTAQARLAELSQWLPIDGHPDAPLGELVETNSTGPLRLGYGAWRDLLLGVQFRNGLGELITAGGRTVKNVAGYDLTKFMVGQHGIFGRVETLTTRTYRRPAGTLLASFDSSFEPASLLATDARPQWAARTPAGAWCGYVGDGRTLGFYQTRVPSAGPVSVLEMSVEEDARFRQAFHLEGDLVIRASLAPARVVEFMDRLGRREWAGDAAFGIVRFLAHSQEVQSVLNAVRSASGSASVTGAGGELLFVQASEGQHRLLTLLKRAFDPNGRLRPLPEFV